MIISKISNLPIIEHIEPKAYLRDLSNIKIIARTAGSNNPNNNDIYVLIKSPDFFIEEIISEPMVFSAISKHGFMPIEESIILINQEEIKKFALRLIHS